MRAFLHALAGILSLAVAVIFARGAVIAEASHNLPFLGGCVAGLPRGPAC